MKRRWIAVLFLLLATPVIQAQVECPPPLQDDQELSRYLQAWQDCGDEMAEEARTDTNRMLVEEGKETIEAKPAATTGFGSQIRDSIEDFLPFFGFAVDSLTSSDDDRQAILRFNPIRTARWGSLAFTATATEPEPGSTFLSQVSEAQRAKLKELAAEDLGDLSDLTVGAKWGWERVVTSEDRWVLGRSYDRYEPFIEDLILPALMRTNLMEEEKQAVDKRIETCAQQFDVDGVVGDPLPMKIAAVREVLGADFEACLDAWRNRRAIVIRQDARLDKLSLLPYLIDNQPQLVFSGAWHERDPIVDRDGWNVKVTYEKGLANFNTLLRHYHGVRSDDPDTALVDAFWQAVDSLDEDAVEAENKFTVSVAYGTRDRYRVDRTFGEGDDVIPVSFDLGEATEWCGKLEWQRNATWHSIPIGDSVVNPRFHLSGEYIDVSDDPMRQDRLVAIATYEIPIPKGTKLPWPAGTSIPLSLTYANHSEFLGEPDEQLSAHFGISYKLPEKKKG